jgi:hypothetical protein
MFGTAPFTLHPHYENSMVAELPICVLDKSRHHGNMDVNTLTADSGDRGTR